MVLPKSYFFDFSVVEKQILLATLNGYSTDSTWLGPGERIEEDGAYFADREERADDLTKLVRRKLISVRSTDSPSLVIVRLTWMGQFVAACWDAILDEEREARRTLKTQQEHRPVCEECSRPLTERPDLGESGTHVCYNPKCSKAVNCSKASSAIDVNKHRARRRKA